MSRKEIYEEIEEMLGVVPSFLKKVPDSSLELEWKLMKKAQFDEGPIPNKYRELIGVAISAAAKCRYCSFYHTEMAKVNGATEEEIEDAVHFAKSSAGWSTYINGLQMDEQQFKEEVQKACDFVRSKEGAEKMLSCRDVGVDCDFVARGKSEEEVLQKTVEHARKEHGYKGIPPELEKKVRAAIRTAA